MARLFVDAVMKNEKMKTFSRLLSHLDERWKSKRAPEMKLFALELLAYCAWFFTLNFVQMTHNPGKLDQKKRRFRT